jgi:ABC-2 type transport system ATP-binding protein
MTVIEIRRLRKEYRRLRGGRVKALQELDLDVSAGGVFGFLGPNGSGKTTTIRCLLGLVRPTSGVCRILGADPTTPELAGVIGRIGSIVETPAMHPGFSGRRNLEILGRIDGVQKKRVSEVIESVGLSGRAGDRVKTYSLGMKQRLGIAAALLKNPEVLILDEPANGLDPAGIKEVRELVRRLANEGRTVFVSSHILSEVRQMCDRVAILSRGRCVAQGPVGRVLEGGRATGLLVRVDDGPRAAAILNGAGIEATDSNGKLRVGVSPSDGARVTKVLADSGVYLSELRPDEEDLEEVFLRLTQEERSE